MDVINAIILGIIQGLTEFLPVSSSGHIELGKVVLGVEIEENILFTVVLHFATALSTIVIFRKDILELVKGIFQFEWNEECKFAVKVIISMIPAALVGYFLEDELEALFDGNLLLVGCMLIITAILLYFADKAKNTHKKVSYSNAIVIGIAQAIAILPGVSRSGATISTSVLLGNDKTKAARFSFLMVVPLIFGKIAKDIFTGKIEFKSEQLAPLSIGFAAAFVAGLFACTWMINLVKRSKLTYFSIYCLLVGLIAVGYVAYQTFA
ncbi:MAG: undecaprenyl-diphosphate phosphatase [Bacteroidota bacterium]